MTALRTAVSALGAFDPDANDDGPPARSRKAVRLTAQMATLVAVLDRRMKMHLSVTGGHLYVDIAGRNLSGAVTEHRIGSAP